MKVDFLTVTLDSNVSPPDSELTVELEQIKPPKISEYASASDVYSMWNMSKSGYSARLLRASGCPARIVDGDVVFSLGFYAWPSELDLYYTLSSSLGEIGRKSYVRVERQMTFVVNNSSTLDLPYFMEDISIIWKTPIYNIYGEVLQPPKIVNHNTWLEFDKEILGVARISGTAVGHSYTVTVTLEKNLSEVEKSAEDIEKEFYDQLRRNNRLLVAKPTEMQGNKITDLHITVTASWENENGEDETSNTQLVLELPKCVEDLLSLCPDEFEEVVSLLCTTVSTRQVYYSTCTGEILEVHDGENPTKFCSRLGETSVGAWGVGL